MPSALLGPNLTDMPLPRILTHNLTWKLIALVSATLVWMTLKSGTPSRNQPRSSRVFHQLPVAVMTAPGDRRALQLDPQTVDVQVGGAPEMLPRVRPRDVRAFVDLKPVTEESQFRLRVEVHTPFGVILDKVTPAEVTGQWRPPPPSEP